MTAGLRTLAVALCFAGALLSCRHESTPAKETKVSHSRIVEIVPGKSIGDIRLGVKVGSLPPQTVINRPGGTPDGIRFLIGNADIVEDVWIEDIRTFPHELRFQGKSIPRAATIEDLNALLRKCERLSDIKGGIFYNCAAGLAVGMNFSRKTLQIRVKPISTEADE